MAPPEPSTTRRGWGKELYWAVTDPTFNCWHKQERWDIKQDS